MTRKRWLSVLGVVVGVVLAWSLFATLGGDRDAAHSAWVREVEAAHSSADQASDASALARAEAALRSAHDSAPQGLGVAEVWLLQDLCGRLAELRMASGDPNGALEWVERGLAQTAELSIAKADLLRQKGDALEALDRKEEAAAALHEALKANQALLDRVLEGETLERDPR